MADKRITMSVLGMLDEKASKAMIQKQLAEIGKSSKVTFGAVNTGLKDATKSMKEYSKAQELVNAQLIKQTIKERELASISGKSAKESAKVFQEKAKALTLVNEKLTKQAVKERELSNLSGKLAKESAKAFQELMPELNKTSDGLDNISKSAKNTGQRFGEIILKFSEWIAVSSLVFGTIEVFKDLISTIKELDDAILEVSKVSDMSANSLNAFAHQASEAGKEVNATASEILRATAEFRRMSFGDEVSMQLAQDALILTKISDGINDISTASTSMISIMKAFNLTAEDSRHIIDSVNNVSNQFAIQSDQIVEGLSRVGGTLAQTGTSMEQTIGLLTAGQQSLQNIEKVSSGLITISSRLRRMEEDVTDVTGTTVKLGEAFEKYAGIELQTREGELRSTYDVLIDLSKQWDNLNDEQQAYIGFLVSGSRQAPVLNSVLSSLDTTLGATEEAINSNGSALEEFEKVSERLQGKIDTLQSTWSRIKTDMLSSSTLSSVLDLANAVAVLAEETEFLEKVFFGVLGVGAFSDYAENFMAFENALNSLEDESLSASEKMNILSSAIDEIGDSGSRNAKMTQTLIDSFNKLKPPTTFFDPEAYSATSKAISSTTEAIENQTEALKSQEEVRDDLNSLIEDSNSQASDTISQLSQLSDINQQLTEDETISAETLLSLIQKYPEYALQISNLNGSKEAGINITEMLFEAEKAQAIAQLMSLREQYKAELDLLDVKLEHVRLAEKLGDITGADFSEFYKYRDAISGVDASIRMIEGLSIDDVSLVGTSGTKKTTEETEKQVKELDKYFEQLGRISLIQKEISKLEAIESAQGVDLSEEKIDQYKILQEELRKYNILLKQEKSELEANVKTGEEEVERQERLLEISEELKDNQTQAFNIQSDINDILEKRSDLEEEYRKDILDKIIEARKNELDLMIDSKEDERDLLEESLDDFEKAENEKTDKLKEQIKERYEEQKEGLERQKDLLDDAFDAFTKELDDEDRAQEIADIQAKLQLSISEKERYDLQEELNDLLQEQQLSDIKADVDSQKKALDEEINLLDRKEENELDKIEESNNEKIKLMENLVQKQINEIEKEISSIENLYNNLATFSENMLVNNANNIYNYLSENLSNFGEYTSAMVSELQSAISSVSGGMSLSGNMGTLDMSNLQSTLMEKMRNSGTNFDFMPRYTPNNYTTNNNSSGDVSLTVNLGGINANSVAQGQQIGKSIATTIDSNLRARGISTSRVPNPRR